MLIYKNVYVCRFNHFYPPHFFSVCESFFRLDGNMINALIFSNKIGLDQLAKPELRMG